MTTIETITENYRVKEEIDDVINLFEDYMKTIKVTLFVVVDRYNQDLKKWETYNEEDVIYLVKSNIIAIY